MVLSGIPWLVNTNKPQCWHASLYVFCNNIHHLFDKRYLIKGKNWHTLFLGREGVVEDLMWNREPTTLGNR